MEPGGTFADAVKQNAYSYNKSVNKSRPLEVMQAVSQYCQSRKQIYQALLVLGFEPLISGLIKKL